MDSAKWAHAPPLRRQPVAKARPPTTGLTADERLWELHLGAPCSPAAATSDGITAMPQQVVGRNCPSASSSGRASSRRCAARRSACQRDAVEQRAVAADASQSREGRPPRGAAVEESWVGHEDVSLPHQDILRAHVGGRADRSLGGTQFGSAGRDRPVGDLHCSAVPPDSSNLTQQTGAVLRRGAPDAVGRVQIESDGPADSHRNALAVGAGSHAHRACAGSAPSVCGGRGCAAPSARG
jgi:hypothetical protein